MHAAPSQYSPPGHAFSARAPAASSSRRLGGGGVLEGVGVALADFVGVGVALADLVGVGVALADLVDVGDLRQ